MISTIIKYAIENKTNKSVYIDSVANGLSCNCICPNIKCGMRLVAIQGNQNEWHFRHKDDSECKGGQETALHQYAKQIVAENCEMQIPKYGKIKYSESIIEKKYLSKRPDISALYNEQPIFFEIAVTHFIEPDKKEFYSQNKNKCIEIDLGVISTDWTPEIVKDKVVNQIENKKIIFWESELQDNIVKNDELNWFSQLEKFCKENPIESIFFGVIILIVLRRIYKCLTK